MGWVVEANKIGKYEQSYKGFRIYCTKEPEIIQTEEQRDDGLWRRTDFIKGDFVAIDKTGIKFEGHYIEDLTFKIDMEITRRYYSKKEGVEIEWS